MTRVLYNNSHSAKQTAKQTTKQIYKQTLNEEKQLAHHFNEAKSIIRPPQPNFAILFFMCL
jgi:hypothetical protein